MERCTDYIRRRSSAFTSAKEQQDSKNLIILGSTKCGKTSLVHRFLHHTFLNEYTPTVENFHKQQFIYRGYMLNLEIVDMCGPFIFPVMRDINIKTAEVALLLYEINNLVSMREAANVLLKINELRGEEKPLHVVLVGTKLDLYNGNDTDELIILASEYFNDYAEWERNHILTSSKDNSNVTAAFHLVMEHIINKNPPTYVRSRSDIRHEKTRSCATQ